MLGGIELQRARRSTVIHAIDQELGVARLALHSEAERTACSRAVTSILRPAAANTARFQLE